MKKNRNLNTLKLFLLIIIVFSCTEYDSIPIQENNSFDNELSYDSEGTSNLRTASSSCGETITGTYSGTGYYTYTTVLDLNSVTNGQTVTIGCDPIDVPNRFTVKLNGSFVLTTGWIGSSTIWGPWGPPFDKSGVMYKSFTKASGNYTLVVETMTTTQSDAYGASINCP